MKKFDRGGEVYGTIDIFGQRPGVSIPGGGILGGYSDPYGGWSVPTAGTGQPMTEAEAEAFRKEFYKNWDPRSGQSIVEREAELKRLLAESGYVPSPDTKDNELPSFLTDPLNQYPTIGGGILQGDQGTATTPTSTRTQDIQSWFENNPNATAQDIFDVMQANNVAPEEVIAAMGFDPESAMAAYNTFLNPGAPATPATPATPMDDQTLLDLIQGGAKDVVTAVSGVVDTGLQKLGELIGMGDPSLVVLNPVNPTASVVYGTPTGNVTPTIIGNMPNSGAPVGVVTGIPALDNIIAGVFNQRGQGGRELEDIVRDVVLGSIGNETGYPVDAVAGAIGGGLEGDLNSVVDSVTKVVLGVDKKLEGDAGVDPLSIVNEASTEDKTVVGDTTGGDKTVVGDTTGGDKTVVGDTTGGDKTVVGDTTDGNKTVVGDTNTTVTLTPDDLGESNPEDVVDIVAATDAPRTTVPQIPVTSLYGQGIRGMKTEQAEDIPLEDTFDFRDISLAEALRSLLTTGDNAQRTSYYGGGGVNSANSLDEIIRLLRG